MRVAVEAVLGLLPSPMIRDWTGLDEGPAQSVGETVSVSASDSGGQREPPTTTGRGTSPGGGSGWFGRLPGLGVVQPSTRLRWKTSCMTLDNHLTGASSQEWSEEAELGLVDITVNVSSPRQHKILKSCINP